MYTVIYDEEALKNLEKLEKNILKKRLRKRTKDKEISQHGLSG
jgi:mRNA-degrading endonuclease RelE of RelBE toxin-antitoxin system